MTKYHLSASFYIVLLLILFGSDLLYDVSWIWYFVLATSYSVLLFLGVTLTQFNFFVNHHCSGKGKNNEIALSFDDGPNAEFTEKVLAKLSKFGIKASFFLIGKNIENHRELMQRIFDEGHIIGNHSYYHRKRFYVSKSRVLEEEIHKASDYIKSLIGKKPLFFRPPFGLTNPKVARAIKRTKVLPIAWSLRTYDTTISKERVIKKIRRDLKGGDIILLHDNHESVLDILDFLIPFAQQNGLKFVPLDALLNRNAYE